MKYNCKNCLFANVLKSGQVLCDKRVFEGVKVYLSKEQAKLSCPSHSSYPRKETRYMRPWTWHKDAEDVCQVCTRDLDMFNKDQYTYVDEEYEDEDGTIKTRTVRKCRICIEKGR